MDATVPPDELDEPDELSALLEDVPDSPPTVMGLPLDWDWLESPDGLGELSALPEEFPASPPTVIGLPSDWAADTDGAPWRTRLNVRSSATLVNARRRFM